MKYVCFGEIMGRINPVGFKRIVQTENFEITYGGGEANVAVSLANYGKDAAYVTKMPDNIISQAALRTLKAHNVNVNDVVFGGDRLGLYFVEKGASQRPSTVIYDRKHSAISEAKREDFDWNKIFKDCCWFHFTGITPALGKNVAEICIDACKTAKEKGIKVSCDLNYRAKLWSAKEACETMSKLMEYVDVLIANEEDSEKVFGISAPDSDVKSGELSKDGYMYVAKALKDRFGIPAVAITLRKSISASDNLWSGMLYKDNDFYFSKEYSVHIVDRVGGGDSFGGGLIYAISENYKNQDIIEFAVAASCLKHSIEGDFNEVSVQEVLKLMNGDGSGRVQR
ncbi:MAG: sugar kinase [Clostridia bacterium]|nr:sugar kinase [Clostridia bacterium]